MKDKKGQTLIEVLAAFGIAVSLVSAITVTVIFALSTTQFGKNKNLATQYAQQGIEAVRRLQAAGQLDIADGTQCLDIGRNSFSTKVSARCPADATSFIREITVRSGTNSSCNPSKEIIVTLYWSDNKCTQNDLYCHKTEVTSCLSGIDSVAIPGQALVSPTPTVPPNPPSGLYGAYNTTSGYTDLSWTAVAGATSYSLYDCPSSTMCNRSGMFVTVLPVPPSTTPLTYTRRAGGGCGTAYYAISVNVSGSGDSALSSLISVSSAYTCE